MDGDGDDGAGVSADTSTLSKDLLTAENIHAIIASHRSGKIYDGAIPDGGGCIPFTYLRMEKMLRYLETWRQHETEINRNMFDAIEHNCPENPERRYVSSKLIPFADFNDGSDVFVVITQGAHRGRILGIYAGPYRVVKAADDLEQFIALGKDNLARVL